VSDAAVSPASPAALRPSPLPASLAECTVAILDDHPMCPVGVDVAGALRACSSALEAAGAHVKRDTLPPCFGSTSLTLYMRLLGAKGCSADPEGHARLLRAARALRPSDGTEAGPPLAEYARGAAMTHGEWIHANGERLRLEAAADAFFGHGGFGSGGYDVLISPVAPCAAIPRNELPGQDAYTPGRAIAVDGSTRGYDALFFWPHYATLVGQPSVAVPICTTAGGLPVGVQVSGPRGADELVIHFAGMLAANVSALAHGI